MVAMVRVMTNILHNNRFQYIYVKQKQRFSKDMQTRYYYSYVQFYRDTTM